MHLPKRLYGGCVFVDWPSYANVDRLDRGAMPILDMMHESGILVDKGHFAGLQKQLEDKRAEFVEEAQVLVGNHAPNLKLSSPPQVAMVLYETLGLVPPGRPKRTKDGLFSTDDDVLSSMTKMHPFVETVINFREVNTLLNNFVRPIPRMVQLDQRLRTVFKNTRTATGRLSSGDRSQGLVNLQNIPTRGEWGTLIRNGFIAGKGNVLVSMDLSQVEMRIAAHMALHYFGDKGMAQIFWNGWDIHDRTAAAMFKLAIERINELRAKVEEEERTKTKILTPDEKAEWIRFKRDQRAPAKNLGFGILFGLTAEGLQRNILAEGGAYFTVEECQEYIDKWFATYPGIKQWMELQFSRIRQYGMCWCLFGRTRQEPGVRSVLQDKVSEAEREAGNQPIQCLPADTRIRTQRGYQRIGEFKSGVVWTGASWASARRIYKGTGQIVSVHLDDGSEFLCDTAHRVLVSRNPWPEWVNVLSLQKGDILPHTLTTDRGGLRLETDEFWYWVGRYYGDGNLFETPSPDRRHYVTWAFGGHKSVDAYRCYQYLRREGFRPRIKTYKKTGKTGYVSTIVRVEDTQFNRRMLKHGITPNQIAKNKRIADVVFLLSRSRRQAFVDGYYAADGTTRKWNPKGWTATAITSVNKQLLQDTQLILRSLGKFSYIKGPYRQKVEGHLPFYRLFITPEVRQRRVVGVVPTGRSENVFTLSVNDPRHAFDSEGVISKNSTAQGLIKLAMAEITPVVLYFQSFPSETCLPLIQIHDELVFECSKPIAQELAYMGREIMRNADRGQLLVPIDSSASMAERWGEAK